MASPQHSIVQIPEFQQPHVHMKNPKEVNAKLQKMAADGRDKYIVVCDFDHTLTKPNRAGDPVTGALGITVSPPCMSKEYKQDMKTGLASFPKDIPTTAEGMKALQLKFFNVLASVCSKHRVNQTLLTEMISSSDIDFRDGFLEFVKQIDDANVPLLIVSAGFKELILGVLQNKARCPLKLHIIANQFKWDEEHVISSVVEEQMHLYNKSDWVAEYAASCPEIRKRNNAVVVGDHLPDSKIADKISQQDSKLTVGFLNSKIEQKLETYKDQYDVVLANDDSFTLINAINKHVLRI